MWLSVYFVCEVPCVPNYKVLISSACKEYKGSDEAEH